MTSFNYPISGLSTAASAAVLSNTTPASIKSPIKPTPQAYNPSPSCIDKDAGVDSSVTVSLSDNMWIDIIIPKRCKDECDKVIKTICESHQNLWQYGYSGSREERAKKIAQGNPPESTGFRGRVTYTITDGNGNKSESTCHTRCGFFRSYTPLPEPEPTPLTDPPAKEISYPECLEDVVSDLQTALTKVVSEATNDTSLDVRA